jgi:hypothetical protein
MAPELSQRLTVSNLLSINSCIEKDVLTSKNNEACGHIGSIVRIEEEDDGVSPPCRDRNIKLVVHGASFQVIPNSEKAATCFQSAEKDNINFEQILGCSPF